MSHSYGTLPLLIAEVFEIIGAVRIDEKDVVAMLDEHGEAAVLRAVLIGITKSCPSAGDMRTIVDVWLDGVTSPSAVRKVERDRKRKQRAE